MINVKGYLMGSVPNGHLLPAYFLSLSIFSEVVQTSHCPGHPHHETYVISCSPSLLTVLERLLYSTC